MRVVDFFSGAGGFSEGFRQQGFQIVMGIDNWRPAVETHNLNHGLNDTPVDILDFENDWEAIDRRIPDTEVIIGSPPCVDFSMSNRAGKAHKGLGIRLIETYLRIIAVKKLKKGSILRAWLLENVPNSRNFVQETYSLGDLRLEEWARAQGLKIDPKVPILSAKNNGGIFNAAAYGSAQGRQRFICGELVASGEFPLPAVTHAPDGRDGLSRYVWLRDIKQRMPRPLDGTSDRTWSDPNYPQLTLMTAEITDHFYDTGVYQVEWEKSREAKVNHAYMGKMQFPEGEDRPSRTIMATRSASTREALLYRSEYARQGNGQYRLPTIREIASLMGFPYAYQFVGSEGTKWRLIGNAVCPHMACALAKVVRREAFGLEPIPNDMLNFEGLIGRHTLVNNLNTNREASFDAQLRRNRGAKFRMHPFKAGNMTVALQNYDPRRGSQAGRNGKAWHAVVYLGAGDTYQYASVTDSMFAAIDELMDSALPKVRSFKHEFETKVLPRVADTATLQRLFEENTYNDPTYLNPGRLVTEIGTLIEHYVDRELLVANVRLRGISKHMIPACQVLAMWAFYRVAECAKEPVTPRLPGL